MTKIILALIISAVAFAQPPAPNPQRNPACSPLCPVAAKHHRGVTRRLANNPVTRTVGRGFKGLGKGLKWAGW
jgi:hypothetical protein